MIKVQWYFSVRIILAFLCALFFIPVTLSFGFDGKPDIKLYYGFIRVFRMKDSDGKKKKPKKEKKEKDKKKDKEKGGIFESLKKISREENGLRFILDVIKEIKEIVKHTTKKTIKNLHIVIKKLSIAVASDDAAKTGQTYAAICSAVFPALGFFQSKCSLRIKRLSIIPDFTLIKPDVRCHINVWLIPAFFVPVLLSALFKWLKISSKIDKQELIIDAKKKKEQSGNKRKDPDGHGFKTANK